MGTIIREIPREEQVYHNKWGSKAFRLTIPTDEGVEYADIILNEQHPEAPEKLVDGIWVNTPVPFAFNPLHDYKDRGLIPWVGLMSETLDKVCDAIDEEFPGTDASAVFRKVMTEEVA